MKTVFAALLFVLPAVADTTFVDISAPVIIYQSGWNAQFTPTITTAADGFTVALSYGFNQPSTQAMLGLQETLTLTQLTMVALNYSASGTLYGGACSHNFCPGMNIGIDASAGIEGQDTVLVDASGSSSNPYLGVAQASGSNGGEWLLGPGTYSVFQYAGFTASDAGIASDFQASLAFTITDPPIGAVPEPRWIAGFGLAALLAVQAWRRTAQRPAKARIGTLL